MTAIGPRHVRLVHLACRILDLHRGVDRRRAREVANAADERRLAGIVCGREILLLQRLAQALLVGLTRGAFTRGKIGRKNAERLAQIDIEPAPPA